MYSCILFLLASNHALFFSSLVVTVQYKEGQYRVEEGTGYVTLALVLDKEAPFPVTVSVNTLNLLDSSVGDAATGEIPYSGKILRGLTFVFFTIWAKS